MQINSFRGDYGFLSNMHSCSVWFEGIVFPSAEHAYQAAKFTDWSDRQHIAKMASPVEAKRYPKFVRTHGLEINHPLDPDFDRYKIKQMKRILYDKFVNHKDMGVRLLATAPAELIEGGWWHDGFWGTCTCGKCQPGQNNLGKLLMEIRDILKGMRL